MVGVGRDFCGSSSPTPMPKQILLEQAAQDRIQAYFEYLQISRDGNPTIPLGSLFQCSFTLTVKKCFLIFR